MSFKNKVVLITGGSAGIGAVTAEEFAKAGADIAIVGRNEEKLHQVAKNCQIYGVTVLPLTADLTKDDQVKSMFQKFIEKFETIDILVNNAGIFNTCPVISPNALDIYDKMNNLNLRAAVILTNLAAPFLIKSKGNIVNLSSVVGSTLVGKSDMGWYSATKAALNQFTKASALELAASGVRVNGVTPGPVSTEMLDYIYEGQNRYCYTDLTALNRISEPIEVAEVIMFLASDKAVGVTGSNYDVDNGLRLKY